MELADRIDRLERGQYRLKLRDADLLRLQPGDVVVLNIARPLASDEREAIAAAWTDTMLVAGQAVPIIIFAGEEVRLEVVRQEVASGVPQ